MKLNKKKLITHLKEHLVYNKKHDHYDKFPQLLLDRFQSYFQINLRNKWIRFYASLSLNELFHIVNDMHIVKHDVGNEQRPQKTQLVKLSAVDKKYYDEMLINMFYGENEDGPLMCLIKGYASIFFSNYLHRLFLIQEFIEGRYVITNETPYDPIYLEGKEGVSNEVKFKDKSFPQLYADYPTLCDEFLKLPIMCKVNVYFSDNLMTNLFGKSEHFQHGNDNTTPLQKVHSIESQNNKFLKLSAGYRYSELEQKEDGSVWKNPKKIFDYKKIRKNSPITLLGDRQLKKVRGPLKGYKPDGTRDEDRGYQWERAKFVDLKPYELCATMALMYEAYKQGKVFVDLSLMENIREMVKGDKFHFNQKTYEKDLRNFCKFYNTLQDIQNLDPEINEQTKLFQYNITRIANHFLIWLYLKKNGRFVSGNKIFALQYAKLIQHFHQITDWMLNTAELDFNGHRKGASKAEDQVKQINAFWKILTEGKHDFIGEDDKGNKVSQSVDLLKENYLDWGYRFRDPNDKFHDDDISEALRQNPFCFLTGQKVMKNLLQAHHLIYRWLGGPTTLENLRMITNTINRDDLNDYPSTSAYLKDKLITQPEIFTEERRLFWQSGELDKLVEYENNPENYYFPSVK